MSLADDDYMKLSKFFMSANLYQFTVFYSQNFDILFNYASPMAEASEDLKVAASQVLQSEGLEYENVKVVKLPGDDHVAVYEGNRIRVVLLLKPQGMTPFVAKYLRLILKEFADRFEDKFRKELKNYSQYTGSFTNIQDIFNESFTLDLSLPHISRYKGFTPEDKLEEYIFQAADKFYKTVGYFYLQNLVFLTKQHVIDEARNIVMSDPARAKKEGIDPDKIDFPPEATFYVAMFNLRKLGMLEPVKTENLGSYSKIYYAPAAK